MNFIHIIGNQVGPGRTQNGQVGPKIRTKIGSLIIQNSDHQSGQSTLKCHDHTLYMLYSWEPSRT